MCTDMGGYRCVQREWMQLCKDMGEYRCERTWDDTDKGEYGRMQMCKDMIEYRCERTWEDTDV